MAISYCPSIGEKVADFILALPKVTLKDRQGIEELLEQLAETPGDVVFNLNYVNDPTADIDISMSDNEIYNLFVRLQAIGDRKHDGTIFIWGVNYPSKPQKDSHPLNKILCAPCVPDEASYLKDPVISHVKANEAYQEAKKSFEREFLQK